MNVALNPMTAWNLSVAIQRILGDIALEDLDDITLEYDEVPVVDAVALHMNVKVISIDEKEEDE